MIEKSYESLENVLKILKKSWISQNLALCLQTSYTKVIEITEKCNMNRPLENINISGTLRQMEVNSTVIFPATIEWSTIRTIAGRFNSAGHSAYSVNKVEDGYKVTRTR